MLYSLIFSLTKTTDFHKIIAMKIFVTGATGFIGSHLIDYLLNHKDAEIYALIRNPSNLKWLKELKIHFLEGDLFSIPLLPNDLQYVFHIAGKTKALKTADYYTVNQQGTASLFQSLRSQSIFPKKIVYLSSLSATGPCSDEKPSRESVSPNPVSPYGKSKLLGEIEALKFKNDYSIVILRVGAVFGPRDKDFLNFFKFIKRGFLPDFDPYQSRISLCYIKDLINAIHLSAESSLESGEILHIAHPEPYSWVELGEAAARIMGKKLIKLKIPLRVTQFAASISEALSKISRKPSIINRDKVIEMKQKGGWVADTHKAEEKLSFRAQYNIEDALKETIDWYIKNNWL